MHRLARPVRTGLRTVPRVLGARQLLGLLGGVCLWLAFPGHDVWWLAVVGCAALALATAGATWWAGALSGVLLGLAWFTPMFTWAGTYAGIPAWLGMSVASALYPAALGAVLALLQRGGRVRPVIGAAAWVLMEWARSVTPFGGFPWARLGFSQADSPMLGAVSLLAVPGLGFLVALAGGLLAVAVQRLMAPGGAQPRRAAVALAGAAVLVAGPVLVPRPTAGEAVTVAAVQGDLPDGFSRTLTAEPGVMLDRYADATHALADEVAAGGTPPDLVVWPEGATDLDPLDPRAGQAATDRIMGAVEAVGAPMLLGGLSRQGGAGPAFNMVFSYLPGHGLDQTYSKVYLAPFGEVMPLRPLLRYLSPWVDRIVDLNAGDRPGLMPVPLATGRTVNLGLAICFEVVVDRAVRDLVTGGAQLLVVPTSNAWFGESDQSVQHLAVSRVRAVEYGRSVAHVSNVGVSGLITPDGVVHARSDPYTQATLLGQLPLRTEQTLAVRTGPWVVPAAAGVVVLGMVRMAVRRRRDRVAGPSEAAEMRVAERSVPPTAGGR
ncbi:MULTISPECIES: apolipoprotein N-acyltransferase [Ornithinimicrobium]|uniref:apolipoprotein N-acyltransferase n=1 Tax=Ornithinimicrobium TaxID=125287 RepID=UPI0009F88D47|nr:apolipoprotein N-acyltransferase [Ornithinimicrobium sp. CNJ-824]